MPFNWSSFKRLGLLAAITVACPAPASADFNLEELMRGNVPPYTVRSGHPRLFITAKNKPLLIRRITESAVGRETFQEVIKTADRGLGIDFRAIPDGNAAITYRRSFLPYIEAFGVLHQLGLLPGFTYGGIPYDRITSEERTARAELYARKGVEALTALAALNQATQLKVASFDMRLTGLAVGYDWLADLPLETFTSEQRVSVVQKLLSTIQVWPVGTTAPPNPSQSPTPNRGGWAYAFPEGVEMLHALAIYGDGIPIDMTILIDGQNVHFTNAAAAAEQIVQTLLTKVWWGPNGSQTRHYRLMSSGVTSEEIQYAQAYIRFFPALEAWYTATGQDFWQVDSFWKGFAQWLIYDTMPHVEGGPGLWYYVKMQQVYSEGGALDQYQMRDMLGAATAWLGRMGERELAEAAAWATQLERRNYFYYRSLPDRFFYLVLMGDPLVTPKAPSQAGIPPSVILRGSLNRVFFRSHWNDADATFLLHDIGEWACLRSVPQTMNTIFLWKNGGPLLAQKNGYRHDYFPHLDDFRYNVVLTYQPGDYADHFNPSPSAIYGSSGCDGRWYDTTRFTDRGGFLRGAILEPGKYGYTAGDASKFLSNRTRTWPNPNGPITSSDRQLAWFPSADGKDFFILFDRITTDGVQVQPHLAFNTVGEPLVANDFDTPLIGESRQVGHWVVRDGHTVTVANTTTYADGRPPAHGKLFLEALLPKQVTIHRLGGTGRSYTYQGSDGKPHTIDATYAVDVNDQLVEGSINALTNEGMTGNLGSFSGLWRFHVVNQNLEPNNRYLMAMEATDSGQLRPTGTMTLLEGQGIVGAAVANTIGLFNPVYQPLLSGRLTLPQTLTLPDGATGYRLLIADLEPRAIYSLTLGSIEQTATASEAGTIYLEGVTLHPGDTLTLAKIGVAPPPPPPVVRGDANQDGVVNLRDAIQLLRWIAGQPGRPEPGTDRFLAADVDRDGRLTLSDFICLLRGIVSGGTLPC